MGTYLALLRQRDLAEIASETAGIAEKRGGKLRWLWEDDRKRDA